MSTPAPATTATTTAHAPSIAEAQAEIGARLERLPITRNVWWARNIVGAATFFDGYTVIAIAYAMPVLTKEWQLSPAQIGTILSAGYLGQLLGSVFFGWLAERPHVPVLTCHDEYLLHTMFDVDGALVGYGCIAPEPLLEMIAAGKAKDYAKARALHDRLLPVTKSVYHRGSHMEGSVALKWALVARGLLDHATVRSPLLPLTEGADKEIAAAMAAAGLGKVG
ncbi:dihydrodipicolinate synthase family protein [Xanthomonas sacchari]|uniref:dihydrodipicolinate synthase family protein n=1 Tax=Xanthomonas sacchari TaxID=56458 RepID=UPI002254CC8E|nr:dihydrodipicolinate synthase family protein [Xanthomonas sacchari]